MLKHYIEWMYSGGFFNESESKPVKSRDRKPRKIPEYAFGYRFYSVEEIKSPDTGEILKGRAKDYSPTTFFGEVYTLERVKSELPEEKILISNMEGNKWNKVVKTEGGQFLPLEKGDKVLPVSA